MTAIQHTPGPWTAREANGRFIDTEWTADNPEHGLTQFAPIHANGVVIALVVRTDWNDAQLEADAQLLAAAPKLLAALRELQANPNDPRAHRTALDAMKLATVA
ncbi:hypothetical protein [Cupriavidus metallidurans]